MRAQTTTLPLDQLFRALADPTRLRLLNLISGREICVCYLVEILSMSQPKISRHLAYLRRAGIAAARRQGKWMYYRIVVPQDRVAASILKAALDQLRHRPDLRQDVTRLNSVCCHPQNSDLPAEAPKPALAIQSGS